MRIKDLKDLVKVQGTRWVCWRSLYAIKKKTGLLQRRFPIDDFDTISLKSLVRNDVPSDSNGYLNYREKKQNVFFFPIGQPPAPSTIKQAISISAQSRVLEIADRFCNGEFLYYSHHKHSLGLPTNWLFNPFTNSQDNADKHWCSHPTFSATTGDIKDIWEPSRFSCGYWLVRAYALTQDDKYAEAFWDHFESWCQQNPHNRGPNWKCGQEAALRTMAWCFSLFGFWKSPSTTADRISNLVKLIALHARRIAGNIDFAVSQKNNHAISEAAGLFTVGILFPELKEAGKWHNIGRCILEKEAEKQIYDDGAYVQQSMNYHRVMLQDYLWAIQLANINQKPLSENLVQRVRKATLFLHQVTDPDSGQLPNYGANDGALILPLNSCDYTDYRPVIQSSHWAIAGTALYPKGDWDEDVLWLFGRIPNWEERSQVKRTTTRFESGGYYTLKADRTWAMIRCHKYRDRIGHIDPMHLDLWADGVNLLRDRGTFRYFSGSEPGLPDFFKSINAHNTVSIDNKKPLRLVSRFTLLPLPEARLEFMEETEDSILWEGQNRIYESCIPGVVHTRRILVNTKHDHWEITDKIHGQGQHRVELRWHVPVSARIVSNDQRVSKILLHENWALAVTSTQENTIDSIHLINQGEFESTYYGRKSPIATLAVSCYCQLPVTITTTLGKE